LKYSLISCNVIEGVSRVQGFYFVSISIKIQPALHTSAAAVYWWNSKHSGAL